MNESIQPYPDEGKNTRQYVSTGFYAICPRDWIADPRLSSNALRVLLLIDSHITGIPEYHIGHEALLVAFPYSDKTLSRGIKEAQALGYLIVVRHLGSNAYTLPNMKREAYLGIREESDKYVRSNRTDMTDSNRNKFRNKFKNKQQEESAPLVAAPFPSAAASAGSKPFKKLPKPQRDYVSEFNLTLKTNFGSCLDLNALKQEPITALLKLQNQGYEAQDLGARCSLRLKEEVKRKESQGDEIKQPIAWLVSRLRSWLEDSELWESNQREVPDYVPSTEHLPPTYLESDNSEPMSEAEFYDQEPVKEPVKLTEAELAEIEQQRIENQLIQDKLRRTKALTKLRQEFPKHNNSELRSVWIKRYGTVMTDEELELLNAPTPQRS